MTEVRELLRRAAANRRRPQPPSGVQTQAKADESLVPRQTAVQSHHPTYTALMHSHDRMRTRHLPEQAGEG